MRSLILIEVEHGEDTDGLTDMVEHLVSDPDWFGNGSMMITGHTVRVDLPSCFVLDSSHSIVPVWCEDCDTEHDPGKCPLN